MPSRNPMHPDEFIRVDGTVLRRVSDFLYRVELSNGHQLVGHLAKPLKAAPPIIRAGSVVHLELSPCDLSRGRILGVQSASTPAPAPAA
jgi:translation initiation factor IF-1